MAGKPMHVAIAVAVLLAVAVALAQPSGAHAGYSLRQSWLELLDGPATDKSCCYSAACEVDNHCVEAVCKDQPVGQCSQYSCYHCECCPCCGEGQYCYSDSTTPFNPGTCCPNGYKGTDCKTPICAQSCGHGKCTSPNKCTCDSGWGGSSCSVAVCDGGCGNGNCTAPNKCTCESGWSGTHCTEAICTEGCDHGNCTKPNTCVCDKNWRGSACKVPMCPQGCVHGACNQPNVCTCSKGWQGASCDQCVPDPFSYTKIPGNLTVETLAIGGCTWKAGTNATVTITGVANKQILAGALQYRLYETGAQHFVASGTVNYFVCNNKGCDPSKPIALHLEDPSAVPTNYSLSFSYTMTNVTEGAEPSFSLYVYGQDQDHFPYDFDVTVAYNYTTSSTSSLPTLMAPGGALQRLIDLEVSELEEERQELQQERSELAHERDALSEAEEALRQERQRLRQELNALTSPRR